jgi:signal transduction histidine kinase
MTLTTSPAFYQTRWFSTVCALAVLGLLCQVYRIRVHQIKRHLSNRLREREQIAHELHDTLIQSAQGLILLFQGFAGRLPSPDPMRTKMEIALDQADTLLNEARERVSDLRTMDVDSDVVQDLTRAGRELSQNKAIHFSVVSSGEPQLLMRAVADDIFRIGYEALANALLYAKAKTVEIEITYDLKNFRLRVRDDGVGITSKVREPGARPNHFGLRGMQESAERICGRLEVWSRDNSGSEIELKVPAAAAYRNSQTRSRWIPSFFPLRPPGE